MKGWWVSWIQRTEDFRPLTAPPNPAVLAWWCSGYDGDDWPTMVAAVLGEDEDAVRQAVALDWPEAGEWLDETGGEWRILNLIESPAWRPTNRFPLDDWSVERWGAWESAP